MSICLQCKKFFLPTRNTKGMYCGYKCSNGAKSVRYKLTCNCCNKIFEVNNISEIKRGHYKYCSVECKNRKYRINDKYFDLLDSNKCYWLGFILSSLVSIRNNTITLRSKKDMLEKFLIEFDSTYKIKNLKKYSTLKFVSSSLVSNLIEIGLKEGIEMDFPNVPNSYKKDVIRGYFDSCGFHYIDKGSNIVVLYGTGHRFMKEVSIFLKSKMINEKGEWVVVSFNFYDQIFGFPHIEEKWAKFVKSS